MKKTLLKIVALICCLGVLLSGCGSFSLDQWIYDLLYKPGTAFTDMTYTRPDMDQFQTALDQVCASAEEGSLDAVVEDIWDFWDAYDWFYTNLHLANIHYSADMSDRYWETEYNYCMDNSSQVEAGRETMLYALAASPLRETLEGEDYFGADYFDAFDGESVWTEEFTALMEQETELQTRYYALCAEAVDTEYYSEEFFSTYGSQMEALFVELVALRQQIAACAGYDSYPEFAYDFYHYRDYTPADGEKYLQQVGLQLADLYRQVNSDPDIWNLDAYCGELETFTYVKSAANAMGGQVKEAFSSLESLGLYDIAYGSNKYDSSFELFLTSYSAPFVFMSPYLDPGDKLIFAHEFGHFVNDYVCRGSYAGVDVAEVHSQAMEYLSLCYGQGGGELVTYKMADSLCTYVEQAAYGLFEQQVYGLTGEALTVENVRKLYEDIGNTFGFDSWGFDSRDYVMTSHYFTSPMYVISYVVSNDLAMQIYQMELAEPGAGLALYEECIYSGDSYLLYFAETYGLENPFAESRLESVRQMMDELL